MKQFQKNGHNPGNPQDISNKIYVNKKVSGTEPL